MTFLVYVSGLRGPSPQKIPADVGGQPFIDEGIRGCDLAKHALLPEHDDLSLDELTELYPAPQTAEVG